MTVERVLAAAAALRRFSLDEIAAFCDEHPPAILDILAEYAPAVVRIDGGEEGARRWHVVDRAALRHRIGGVARLSEPVVPVGPDSEQRLRYVEETLAHCAAEPSAQRRQVLVATAVNHLRQVLATDLPGRPDWWRVQMGEELETALRRRHPDPATATRLQLDVTVAQLAVGNVRGVAVPTPDLLDTVIRFREGAARLDGQEQVQRLTGCFVDLVTAQLAPTASGAVDQLVVAVARRRVRAQASVDAEGAIRALEPLVRGLGTDSARVPVHGLHQRLGNLPDGRNRVVVYADLLTVMPGRLTWHRRGDRLPGTLVEVVAEPVVASRLAHCARTLEADLHGSGFRSENALIGQAAHVLQELVEQGAVEDGEVRSRGDRTRAELLQLARAPSWPAPMAADDVVADQHRPARAEEWR